MKKRVMAGMLTAGVLACVAMAPPAGAVINSYRKILVDPTYAVAAAPGAIYAGITTGVKKSTDGGVTWVQLAGLATKTTGLAVDPKNPAVVYAATATGLFRSADGGQTWTLLNAAVRYFVTVSPLDSSVLFADNQKSTDGGATWRTMTYKTAANATVAYPLPVNQSLHIKCSADPALPGFMLAAVNESSYHSYDGGENWLFFWRDVDSVEIDPVDARYYYLGGRCGRQAWRYFPGGYKQDGPDHIHGLAVDPANRARLFAVEEYKESFVSTNLGVSWQQGSIISWPYEGRMVFDASTGMVLVPTSSGLAAKNSWCPDADSDGYAPEGGVCGQFDCDDANASIRPGQMEHCWDGIDNNCNGALDMVDAYCALICSDRDQDSFIGTLCRGNDCNDLDAATFPGAPEICDWRDNDCDGQTDEGQADADGDGWYNCSDCNDADPAINPGAAEIALDGIDQDCNGYDQSIRISKASYSPEQHGAIHVRATSAYGDGGWLWVDYYGSMHWEPKKGYWELVTNWIGGKPDTVTICGYEGCVTAPVR